ncbi:MAG: CcmD family protein [Gemmatimonas sp.]|nr:CcmD family protein [Gemmatimonas sp.]
MRWSLILVTSILMQTAISGGMPDRVTAQVMAPVAQVDLAAPATDVAMARQVPAESTAQPPLQPRSTRPYWHVFLAFAAVWLLLFGYALTVGRRFGRLEEEVRRLRSTS